MSKQRKFKYLDQQKISFHQVLRDGALILKREHIPIEGSPQRGPPVLLDAGG